jgi:RiboL-PSP-HEPN
MTPTYFKSTAKIEYLINRCRDSSIDDYLQSHLSNYICVLLSGLLETSIREIISIHSEKRSAPTIANFVKESLERFQNPDPESIYMLFNRFDGDIGERLNSFWSDEIKDAIGSIVGNRHLIAHGRDTTLTITRVLEWFNAAKKFINFVEAEFS